MLHGTRKPDSTPPRAALALGLAVACALAGGSVAWAAGADGGMIGGGGIVGGGSDEGGAAGEAAGGAAVDPSSPADPEKPSGEIVQVMRGTAVADIYLPELACDLFLARDDGEQPPLRSLLVERADAAHPDAWTPGAEIPWNADWQSYDDGDETDPSYLVNAWDEFGIVRYSEPNTDFRDFYVRVTAYVLVGEQVKTLVYGPVLLEFPHDGPPVDPTPPDDESGNPGDADGEGGGAGRDDAQNATPGKPSGDFGDFGGIDGNRGGVGQGESERVEPQQKPEPEPAPLPSPAPSPDGAYPSAGSADNDDIAAERGSQDAAGEGPASSPASASGEPHPTEDGASAAGALPADAAGSDASGTAPVPGFAWAVGGSALAVVGGAAAVALVRRRRTRERR